MTALHEAPCGPEAPGLREGPCGPRATLPFSAVRSASVLEPRRPTEQWKSRRNIAKVELDRDHGGIVKLNPLADWTLDRVWAYVHEHEVPYHELFDHGFTSIGCAPCTRAVLPGEHERAGRWWWESETDKECGIHCSVGLLGSRPDGERTVDGRLALGFGPPEGTDAENAEEAS